MTILLNEEHLEDESLTKKYCPLLVLYPEIEDGSRRKDIIVEVTDRVVHHRWTKTTTPETYALYLTTLAYRA